MIKCPKTSAKTYSYLSSYVSEAHDDHPDLCEQFDTAV